MNIVVITKTHHGFSNCAYFSNKTEFINAAKESLNRSIPEKLNYSIQNDQLFLDEFLDDYNGNYNKNLEWDYFYQTFYNETKLKYPNLDEMISILRNGGEIIRTFEFGYNAKDALMTIDSFDQFEWAKKVFEYDLMHCFILVGDEEIKNYIQYKENNNKMNYPTIPNWIKELCGI